MGNGHGGRRIEIIVMEYPYPRSDSAKRSGCGQMFPIIKTGIHRPNQALEILLEQALEKNLTTLAAQQSTIAWCWIADKNRHDKIKRQSP